MFNYLLYIFDLDGTLINSSHSIQEALRLTALDHGRSEEDLVRGQAMIGMHLRDILGAMGIDDPEGAIDTYRKYYFERILEETAYPGIPQLLRDLHNRLLLSVVTNKGRTGANMALDHQGLLSYFDIVMTVDDGAVKPDPAVLVQLLDFYRHQGKPLEASDCLMIGDSPTDALFAQNCGMDYAHVTWGFYPPDSLHQPAQYYIEEPSQLQSLVDSEMTLEIGPELDLHAFRPHEQIKVVQCYLDAAKKQGYRELRIIHGKGQGVQRARVQSLLSRHKEVFSFSDAPPQMGGWGATLVVLK